ncbi:YidH family protein [Micromonospora sp. KLBMP9576]|uniref:YidH family protein n=1 Tax=Micromonospora sp. KLBMP9576 TaxID=3424769 RepID=UPI003D8D9759
MTDGPRSAAAGGDERPGPADRRWPRRVYGVGTEPDPRFSLANERTFLAWLRTALGLMVAAAAVRAFGADGSRWTAVVLAVLAVGVAVEAFPRWARNERALRLQQPLPSTPVAVVSAAGVVAAGVTIAVVVLI